MKKRTRPRFIGLIILTAVFLIVLIIILVFYFTNREVNKISFSEFKKDVTAVALANLDDNQSQLPQFKNSTSNIIKKIYLQVDSGLNAVVYKGTFELENGKLANFTATALKSESNFFSKNLLFYTGPDFAAWQKTTPNDRKQAQSNTKNTTVFEEAQITYFKNQQIKTTPLSLGKISDRSYVSP